MGRIDIAGVGLDDDSWKAVPRDEARSLLGILSASDGDTHALGARLLNVPNGQELYVTSGIPGFAPLLPA